MPPHPPPHSFRKRDDLPLPTPGPLSKNYFLVLAPEHVRLAAAKFLVLAEMAVSSYRSDSPRCRRSSFSGCAAQGTPREMARIAAAALGSNTEAISSRKWRPDAWSSSAGVPISQRLSK